METSGLVIYLIIATFGLAIAFGIWQWFKVQRSQRLHHHSAKPPPGTPLPPKRTP
jgi:hypothetical protein